MKSSHKTPVKGPLIDVNDNDAKLGADVGAKATGNELSAFRGGVLTSSITVCEKTKNHEGKVKVNAQTICTTM